MNLKLNFSQHQTLVLLSGVGLIKISDYSFEFFLCQKAVKNIIRENNFNLSINERENMN